MPTSPTHLYSLAKLEPFMDPAEILVIEAKFPAAPATLSYQIPKGTVLAESLVTAGTYKPYGQNTTTNGAVATGAGTATLTNAQGFFPGDLFTFAGEAGNKTVQTVVGNVITFTPVIAGAGVANAAAVTQVDTGTSTPKAIAIYDMVIDANGKIAFSATAGQTLGEQLEQHLIAPVYVAGTFFCQDLVGMDATVPTIVGWRLVQGIFSNGIIRLM